MFLSSEADVWAQEWHWKLPLGVLKLRAWSARTSRQVKQPVDFLAIFYIFACFTLAHTSFTGTSGRSTKLIHGGIRYLEAAFLKLDYGMYELVKEALEEVRQSQAPHLLHNWAI